MFVELGGVEVADIGAWDDASADCPVSVESGIDIIGNRVASLAVRLIGVPAIPDVVDTCGSRVDESIVTVIAAVLLGVLSLSKSS